VLDPAFKSDPIGIQTVTIDGDGILRTRVPEFPLSFQFTWRRARFSGTVDRMIDSLVLRFGIALPPLPFTAENRSRRADYLNAINELGDTSEFGRIETKDNRLALMTQELPLEGEASVTPTELVTNLAVALLRSAPCLDLLATCGLLDNTASESAAY
jgi:hypothetical protein